MVTLLTLRRFGLLLLVFLAVRALKMFNDFIAYLR